LGTCQGQGTFEETQVPILLVSATQGEKAVMGIGLISGGCFQPYGSDPPSDISNATSNDSE